MALFRLIYASTASEGLDKDQILSIIEKARINNTNLSLTGCLAFNHKFFLQVLEGSSENLNRVFHKISQDPRHTDIRLIEYSSCSYRNFYQWSMGLLMDSELNRNEIMKYSSSDKFSPYELNSDSAIELMMYLLEKKENRAA